MVNKEQVIAVNLGSGATVAPGWINLDNSPNARLARIPLARQVLRRLGVLSQSHFEVSWPKGLIIRDLKRTLPFAERSVDFVYSSHTLEHLSRQDAIALLKEVFRVLKSGGSARIVVPDLRFYINNYQETTLRNPDDSNAADQLIEELRLSTGGRSPHLWMYDAPSLMARMQDAGFIDVAQMKNKVGRVPDLEILDCRPKDSIHIEALKP